MLTEFEPARVSAKEARAIVALLFAFQPDAVWSFFTENQDDAPAPGLFDSAAAAPLGEPARSPLHFTNPDEPTGGDIDAAAAFAGGAPIVQPDPETAFTSTGPIPLDSGAAAVAAAPGGSGDTAVSTPASASSPTASVSPGPTVQSAATDPGSSGSVTAAPTASPAPSGSTPPPPVAPLLDSSGLPWDERIHAGTKATNQDGTWRGKKGGDKDAMAAILAELRLTFPDTRPPPAPPAPAATPQAQALAAAVADPSAATAPPPPPPAPPAPAADAPTPGPATDFATAMRKVTMLQTAGKLTAADVTSALTVCGFANIRDLIKPENAEQIPTFDSMIDQLAAG